MTMEDRKNRIMALLNNYGYMSVEEISKALYISPATTRRDLATLEKNGFLRRTHGGASINLSTHSSYSIDYRLNYEVEAKKAIAKAAVELVDEGMNLFIDASSTNKWLSNELVKVNHLNVLTNGINIAQILSKNSTIHIEITCGNYNVKHDSVYGPDGAHYISQRRADILFVSATGINDKGIYSGLKEDIPTKQAFSQYADLVVLLMDHSKVNIQQFYLVYDYDIIDVIITDQPLPVDIQNICKEKRIRIITTKTNEKNQAKI